LMLMALLGLVRFRKGAGGAWLWVGMSSMVLAVLARLSNLPYAALLFGMFLWSVLEPGGRRRGMAQILNPGLILGLGTALLAGFVLARTYILTGLLFIAPNALVSLQQQMGLALQYPVGTFPASKLPRLPVGEGMRSMLIDPAALPHIMFTWPGNVWLFLPLALVLMGAARVRSRPGSWPLLVLGASFFVVLFGYALLVPGGDGNYFIFPVACLLMWGMVRIGAANLLESRVLTGVLLFFVLAGAAISFVTGSWGPGTRALDINFRRLPFEYAIHRSHAVASAQLQGVETFFKGQPLGARVIGLEIAGLNEELPSGWWLPARYESIEPFKWLRPEIVQSSVDFKIFLDRQKIRYIIVPKRLKKETKVTAVVLSTLATAASTGSAKVVYEDDAYVVWEMRNPT